MTMIWTSTFCQCDLQKAKLSSSASKYARQLFFNAFVSTVMQNKHLLQMGSEVLFSLFHWIAILTANIDKILHQHRAAGNHSVTQMLHHKNFTCAFVYSLLRSLTINNCRSSHNFLSVVMVTPSAVSYHKVSADCFLGPLLLLTSLLLL